MWKYWKFRYAFSFDIITILLYKPLSFSIHATIHKQLLQIITDLPNIMDYSTNPQSHLFLTCCHNSGNGRDCVIHPNIKILFSKHTQGMSAPLGLFRKVIHDSLQCWPLLKTEVNKLDHRYGFLVAHRLVSVQVLCNSDLSQRC